MPTFDMTSECGGQCLDSRSTWCTNHREILARQVFTINRAPNFTEIGEGMKVCRCVYMYVIMLGQV